MAKENLFTREEVHISLSLLLNRSPPYFLGWYNHYSYHLEWVELAYWSGNYGRAAGNQRRGWKDEYIITWLYWWDCHMDSLQRERLLGVIDILGISTKLRALYSPLPPLSNKLKLISISLIWLKLAYLVMLSILLRAQERRSKYHTPVVMLVSTLEMVNTAL